MPQALVLEVELHVVLAVALISDEEEAFDSALGDRLDFLRGREFDLVAPDVAFCVVEENLVREDLGPAVDKLLNDLFALFLGHGQSGTSVL